MKCVSIKILVSITILQFANAKVIWELVTKPIVFWKDVTLKCSIPQENICRPGGRKWKGGRDDALLIFNEGPVNKAKYGAECMHDDFTLTIMDFSPEDFNKNYTCSFGFDQYTANLTTDNYRFNPMTETFKISNTVSGKSDSIDVHFLKVYPFPQCSLRLDKNYLIKPQNTVKNFTSYFYTGKITFRYELTKEGCGQNLSILCQDATNNIIRLPYSTLIKQCLVQQKEQTILVLVVCLSASLVITVGGCVIFVWYKRKRDYIRTSNKFQSC